MNGWIISQETLRTLALASERTRACAMGRALKLSISDEKMVGLLIEGTDNMWAQKCAQGDKAFTTKFMAGAFLDSYDQSLNLTSPRVFLIFLACHTVSWCAHHEKAPCLTFRYLTLSPRCDLEGTCLLQLWATVIGDN